MKSMNQTTPAALLKTDYPVVPLNGSIWNDVSALEKALRNGVSATRDSNRQGFYEIEVGDNWYYIHVPSRIPKVYLVAVRSAAAQHTDRPAHRPWWGISLGWDCTEQQLRCGGASL